MKNLFLTVSIFCIAIVALAQSRSLSPDRKLAAAEKIIETFYVADVDTTKIVEDAIKAMLKTLDPHSAYSTAEETKELNEPLQGNFSGIGIQFQMLNDTLYVIQTISGGPSERVGILAGDKILTANDSTISGVNRKNSSVMKLLRGPKGSEVNVAVRRGKSPEPIYFRIVRDDIPIHSLDAAYIIQPGVGYIRVSRFAETTPQEFRDAVDKLLNSGMRSLILDLQDNGGGYLNAASEMADMLLPKGALIVYTDGDRVQPAHFYSQRNAMFEGPLVVLVNQYSASASEIVAGAVQDNDRGVVVGRRTFGKGLVQRPFPFPDGSMIRLTVARYHTPSGRCIQKPYSSGDDRDYTLDLLNRYKAGEYSNADSIHFNDSLRYRTLINGRPVYGGGGIMPDMFVPIDTTEYSDYYRDLMAKGIYNRYSVSYVDSTRAALKKRYSDATGFVRNFEVTPQMLEDIAAMGEADSVKIDSVGMATSANLIARVVKALIGRDLFTQDVFYRVTNRSNPVYVRGVEIITSPEEYNRLLTGGENEGE